MAKQDPKSKLESKVDQELDEILASLGPEVTTIKLYRIEGGKQQALASYTPSELAEHPEEVIGGEFGPGNYLLRVILPTLPGKPGNRWGPSKVLSLADDSQYVQDYLKKHVHEPEAGYSGDPMYKILELQIKMAEQRAADTDKRLHEQSNQMHALILAMINNKNGGGGDIASLISGVRSLKELSDGTGGGSKLAELKELFEIASMLQPGGGKDESPWSTLGKVLTTHLANGGGPQKQLQAARAADLPAGKVTVEDVKPAADNPPKLTQPAATTLMEKLMKKAQRGSDPELFADWVVDQADDENVVEAIDLLTSIGASADFEKWWAVLPGSVVVTELKPWWESFYKRIRDAIEGSAPEVRADDTGPKPLAAAAAQ